MKNFIDIKDFTAEEITEYTNKYKRYSHSYNH